MRRTLAYRGFHCRKCRSSFRSMVEIAPKVVQSLKCKCGGTADQEEFQDSKDHNIFRPFWSDTMQMRIRDRVDLQRLRDYAKSKGLVNVGHQRMKPDRAAIRYNYERD